MFFKAFYEKKFFWEGWNFILLLREYLVSFAKKLLSPKKFFSNLYTVRAGDLGQQRFWAN
jgi:hypothetical protein